MHIENKEMTVKDPVDVKKLALMGAKDSVITILRVVDGLKFIDQIETSQLIDGIEKQCQAGYTKNTVNLALFITDTDDHSLFSDGTQFKDLRFKFVENFSVKFSNLFSSDEGCFHKISSVVLNGVPRPESEMIGYVYKYIRKATIFNQSRLAETLCV